MKETGEQKKRIPRLLLAGTHSGVGKTTITCALLRAFARQGRRLAAFKCGPDYIDPMFHREVLGIDSGNLDSFFQDREQLRENMIRHAVGADLAVIEGVMGYYDGIGFASEASTAQVAEWTETPVILIVDCKGRAVSALAELYGFVHFRPEGKRIRGVLLNRFPERLYPEAAKQIKEMGLIPVGYLPEQKEFGLQSRHLGLVTPQEIAGFQEQVDRLAERLEKTVDLSLAEQIAMNAETIASFSENADRHIAADASVPKVRIAIARDAAFCFYYRENIEVLESLGAQVVYFSPLTDTKLPACDALILPGGYPELYAGALEKNESIRADICNKIKGGLPTIAECGGFLYLHKTLTDQTGNTYAGAGALQAECSYQGFQRQFGYITLKAEKDQLLAQAGDELRAHEFHYFVSELETDALCAEKPDHSRNWKAAVATDTFYAGFPHISFAGSPKAAERFVKAAQKYKKENKE